MNSILEQMMHPLINGSLSSTKVIPWASPVPAFGDILQSRIATLGLNPSNREFVDESGRELVGTLRRFPTLTSLNLSDWSQISQNDLNLIWDSCKFYFDNNPYDSWFKKLDYVISSTESSYYFPTRNACHLDLIPYATSCKWVELTLEQKNYLLSVSASILLSLLNASTIDLLILNGQTVVDQLEKLTGCSFQRSHISNWTLPRKIGQGVQGYSYKGTIDNIGGVELDRPITILGYNHNLQSSYGVTNQVHSSIRNWISEMTNEICV